MGFRERFGLGKNRAEEEEFGNDETPELDPDSVEGKKAKLKAMGEQLAELHGEQRVLEDQRRGMAEGKPKTADQDHAIKLKIAQIYWVQEEMSVLAAEIAEQQKEEIEGQSG
ncbi:hypothetical protein KKI23_03395 [Patescibacteria group bacterium]|nr:hypothetical protein [Patescibacteria group bacterium]